MLEIGVLLVLGILGGAAVGLQSPFVSAISQRLGSAAGSFIIHASGAFFSALLLLLYGSEQLAHWRSLPWYLWFGGGFGVILMLTLSITFPRLGATSALVLVILGQLLTGMVLDTFGWLGVAARPFDPLRLIGIMIVVVGAYLVLR